MCLELSLVLEDSRDGRDDGRPQGVVTSRFGTAIGDMSSSSSSSRMAPPRPVKLFNRCCTTRFMPFACRKSIKIRPRQLRVTGTRTKGKIEGVPMRGAGCEG